MPELLQFEAFKTRTDTWTSLKMIGYCQGQYACAYFTFRYHSFRANNHFYGCLWSLKLRCQQNCLREADLPARVICPPRWASKVAFLWGQSLLFSTDSPEAVESHRSRRGSLCRYCWGNTPVGTFLQKTNRGMWSACPPSIAWLQVNTARNI